MKKSQEDHKKSADMQKMLSSSTKAHRSDMLPSQLSLNCFAVVEILTVSNIFPHSLLSP